MVKLDDKIISKIPIDKQPESGMVMRNVFVEDCAYEFTKRTIHSRVGYIKGAK